MEKMTVIEAIEYLFSQCETTRECTALEGFIYRPLLKIYEARMKEIEGPRPLSPDDAAIEILNEKCC